MDANKDTYINYLKELPRFHAPSGVWEKLEVSMFSVDASTFPIAHASEGLWTRIEKTQARRKVVKRGIILLLLLAMIIPGYLWVMTTYNIDSEPHQMHGLAGQSTWDISENEANEGNIIDAQKNNPLESLSSVISHQETDQVSSTDHSGTQQRMKLPIALPVNIHQRSEIIITRMPIKSPSISVKYKSLVVKSREEDCVPSYGSRDDDCSSFYGSNTIFMWGPKYEYQNFLNVVSYQETEAKNWHNLGLNARICFGKVYLESGLGFSFSKDAIPYGYDFLKNELINTYEYVDSVDYDPITGETIHYTSIAEVFDSIPYSKSNASQKTNYYLKIPLMIGVELFKKKDFGLNMSAGIYYSLLVSSKESEISYYEPDSRITTKYYNATNRIKNNFNLSVNINFEWEFNEGLIFYAYPSFNYYLNHIYEGQDGSMPMSVGFGVGLFIK